MTIKTFLYELILSFEMDENGVIGFLIPNAILSIVNYVRNIHTEIINSLLKACAFECVCHLNGLLNCHDCNVTPFHGF